MIINNGWTTTDRINHAYHTRFVDGRQQEHCFAAPLKCVSSENVDFINFPVSSRLAKKLCACCFYSIHYRYNQPNLPNSRMASQKYNALRLHSDLFHLHLLEFISDMFSSHIIRIDVLMFEFWHDKMWLFSKTLLFAYQLNNNSLKCTLSLEP